MEFWYAAMFCIQTACVLPRADDSPAFSIYLTKEACETRLNLMQSNSTNMKWSCIKGNDTITFSPYTGFSGSTSSITIDPK